MNLYYIYDEEDIECSFGLFDNEEAAEFVSERISNLADSPTVKVYFTDNKSVSGVYYFVINLDDGYLDDNCFTTREEAIYYVKDNGFEEFEIHGHKVNSIYSCGNDTVDENGEIVKPNEDDMDSSFYNLALDLKKNNI